MLLYHITCPVSVLIEFLWNWALYSTSCRVEGHKGLLADEKHHKISWGFEGSRFVVQPWLETLLLWSESSCWREAPSVSTGRESLGDELSQLKNMPAVELQAPVLVHMITRQSMLLVHELWKCVDVLLHLAVLCNCLFTGDWRNWNGSMESSYRMATFFGKSRRTPRALLCFILPLIWSYSGAQEKLNSTWKGGVGGGWYSRAFGCEALTEMEMHLHICLTRLEVTLIWRTWMWLFLCRNWVAESEASSTLNVAERVRSSLSFLDATKVFLYQHREDQNWKQAEVCDSEVLVYSWGQRKGFFY